MSTRALPPPLCCLAVVAFRVSTFPWPARSNSDGDGGGSVAPIENVVAPRLRRRWMISVSHWAFSLSLYQCIGYSICSSGWTIDWQAGECSLALGSCSDKSQQQDKTTQKQTHKKNKIGRAAKRMAQTRETEISRNDGSIPAQSRINIVIYIYLLYAPRAPPLLVTTEAPTNGVTTAI